ncbi:putative NACHT [Triplophysa rosa]|uniref:NACHT n=1 Tax=Triplophysa rosa TaxID=992332 RepID=A0A9W7TNE2_TRIRA|nr:putative NACHT [Triplophysa rosa]
MAPVLLACRLLLLILGLWMAVWPLKCDALFSYTRQSFLDIRALFVDSYNKSDMEHVVNQTHGEFFMDIPACIRRLPLITARRKRRRKRGCRGGLKAHLRAGSWLGPSKESFCRRSADWRPLGRPYRWLVSLLPVSISPGPVDGPPRIGPSRRRCGVTPGALRSLSRASPSPEVMYPHEKRTIFMDPLGETDTKMNRCLESTRSSEGDQTRLTNSYLAPVHRQIIMDKPSSDECFPGSRRNKEREKQSDSSVASCVSMRSDGSMAQPLRFKDGNTSHGLMEQEISDSLVASCISMKSDGSMAQPLRFKYGNTSHRLILQERLDSSVPSCISMKSDGSMAQPLRFKDGDTSHSLIEKERSDSSVASCIFMKSDGSMAQALRFKDGDTSHSHKLKPYEVLDKFKSNLRKKFECLCEGTSHERNPTLLNEIYTELYITESESGEISNEHEVRQIERQSRRTATEDTPIKCNDIFKALPAQDKPIRRVLTKGVAGIGKTVSVQKFILDWAEGKENQDVHLIFPLPFREINLMKNQTRSLLHLLHLFFPETKEMEISSGEYKVLFIFDGLDECRVSLDFHSSVRLCDVTESASVDVILTNLMAGNLLPSALIWITSRPAAADLIPSECVDRVTEVRGFTDKQKEEYFSKRISDESLNHRIISHLKSSRSLYIMCHIPVFCWISATVLERMLSEAESEGEIPKTLTQMYTHFLIIQTHIKHQKDYEKKEQNDEDMIFKLGKLAFEQLVKGNVIFYDEDLRECGIDVAEASVYSGLCTQIFREEFGWYQGKVYCFLHLTIQEHLAALYAHLEFINKRTPWLFSMFSSLFYEPPIFFNCVVSDMREAVDAVLLSQNRHLDFFLRFLLGLSVESNQTLLQGLLVPSGNSSQEKMKTIQYIKHKIRENLLPEESINLFHCLNELGDYTLVKEIQHYLRSRTVGDSILSSSQWSALVFALLTSEQKIDVFYLNKFIGAINTADEVLQKLLPVLKESSSAQLSDCGVTDEGCVALASALRSNPSHLRELDLSWNNIGNSGVKLISTGLQNPLCKLEILKLWKCGITAEGCVALSSALRSNPSHLTELYLSWNKIGDSGVKLICDVLENPHCKLEILRLWSCSITDEGCVALTSALRSNPSHLRNLNLSENNVGDSGVKQICDVLENPLCKLEMLRLSWCNITDEGYAALASALRSNPSHLRELDLTGNNLRDSGIKLLSDIKG